MIKYNYNNNKKIYICHKSLDHINKYSKNWKELNPDWQIELYDDRRCKEFLLKEFSEEFVLLFNYLTDGPIKSDFWRTCIIYKYGGLYVDADILPVESLSKIIDPSDYFVTCLSYRFVEKNSNEWNPHFLYTYAGNSILKKTIDCYLFMLRNKINYSYWTYSICTIWKKYIKECKYLTDLIINSGSYHLRIRNLKYKFLLEKKNIKRPGYYGNNYLYNIACFYNNKVVLYNRLLEYDAGNHRFLEENKNYRLPPKFIIQGAIKMPPRDNKIHMLSPGVKKINLNIVR
jgi:hypothetical protein